MGNGEYSLPLATNGDEFVFVRYQEDGPPVLVFYMVDFDLSN